MCSLCELQSGSERKLSIIMQVCVRQAIVYNIICEQTSLRHINHIEGKYILRGKLLTRDDMT